MMFCASLSEACLFRDWFYWQESSRTGRDDKDIGDGGIDCFRSDPPISDFKKELVREVFVDNLEKLSAQVPGLLIPDHLFCHPHSEPVSPMECAVGSRFSAIFIKERMLD